MTDPAYLAYVIGLGAGAVLGAVYFQLVHRTVTLQLQGSGSAAVIGLTVLRIALAVVVFWVVAQFGALPLLLALLGFLAARSVVRRRLEAAQ